MHERVVADGPVARLSGDLLHASAESLDAYIAKQNRYTTLQAEAMHARGERASALRLVVSPLARFFRFYVLRLGFLDGVAGFLHIAIGAFASFMKYAKLRALAAGAAAVSAAASPGRVACSSPAPRDSSACTSRSACSPTGCAVTGVDNLDPYYDVALKEARLARLSRHDAFRFERLDLVDAAATARALSRRRLRGGRPPRGAARRAPFARQSRGLFREQPRPRSATSSKAAVTRASRHLVFASSSSVYGANHALPFSEDQQVDHPVSLYAATKKANELIAHSYAHLFGVPMTGLRFFTVYGPWGRPDMAPMLFTRAILAGQPIRVFNDGRMRRDFTYIDDIAEGVRARARPAAGARCGWRAVRDLQHRQSRGGRR